MIAVTAPVLAESDKRVAVSDVSGAIGVATTRQFTLATGRAQAERAEALIIRLDTPGGLVSSTRELIKQIVASPIPIVVYVAPSGARAASAGTFLVYASHVAAMAPGTNLGAATPIEIGGVPGVPQPRRDEPRKDDKDDKDDKGSSGTQSQSAAERKAINDVVALLRSLAQLRGRSPEFAEKAVRDAATLTAEEAHKQAVVEIVAGDIDDLLAQLDGRKVTIGGAEKVLATKGAQIVTIEPDLRTQLLSVISNPNVAFLLLMIGFYGVILEFWNPGSFVPGVVGAISLILALIGLSALPVNYGSLGLLVLGIALMIGEAFTPGIGVLGIGGLAAFIAGAYFLIEGAGADIDIAVSLPLIIGMAATTALLIFGVIAAAMEARRRVPVTGAEQIIGSIGQVVAWQDATGQIRVLGEVWNARAARPLQTGDTVRVVGRDGLTLIVDS
ncbi:nodulation protein NfeD [Bradyrhizobium sp.]|uniref:NfeD family protein n=1 Tax=Bradyrhizobium sp. TaxID=376 RepID=UPI0025BF9396|nr:nodulation protein NfeD [Bradyrhizobium sp.]